MFELTQNASSFDRFYSGIRDQLARHGMLSLKFSDFPSGVNSRRLRQLKEYITRDLGPGFSVEKGDGVVSIGRAHTPSQSRKTHRPAYVNNR